MMDFSVSEFGFITDFNNFEDAVKYCKDNGLVDGEDGLLWIIGSDMSELKEFMENNEIDHEFMMLKCMGDDKNLIYSTITGEWEDATEVEQDGEEDFDEMFEVRKAYIEDKYGVNHGKRIL
jgi:hypothetical protein